MTSVPVLNLTRSWYDIENIFFKWGNRRLTGLDEMFSTHTDLCEVWLETLLHPANIQKFMYDTTIISILLCNNDVIITS